LMALSVAMVVVVGCSGSQPSNTTTLAPLVTTTSPTTTTTTTMFPDPNRAFLFSLTQDFGSNFDGYYNQIEALLQGNQYCLAARGGMTAFNITDSINEGAETAEEIRLELTILTSALTYLCPDQEYRINP